jgi:hypothetical protein
MKTAGPAVRLTVLHPVEGIRYVGRTGGRTR